MHIKNIIIQWNMRGFRANFLELKTLAQKYRPKIISLQEIFLKENDKSSMRGYQGYHVSSLSADGRPIGGTAILIENSVSHQRISLSTTLQAGAVRVSLVRSITVCSIYLPPRMDFNIAQLENLLNQLPKPYILMGDFNSHSDSWGCTNTDGAGERIEELINRHTLCLLNDDSHTYLHPATKTFHNIDLSICSPSLLLDLEWKVLSDLYGSDHFPIVIKLSGNDTAENQERWVLKRANWELFEALSGELLTEDIFTDKEDPIMIISKIIIEIATKSIPKSSNSSTRVRRPWFDEDCEKAIRLRKAALQSFRWHPDDQHWQRFLKLRAEARRIVKQKKRTSWRKYISQINCRTSSKKIWDMIKKITGRRVTRAANQLQQADGSIAEDAPSIANCLASSIAQSSSTNHYTPAFQRHKSKIEAKTISFKSKNNETYNEPITLLEFKNALNKSHNTAVGPDMVHYSFLKHLPCTAQQIVVDAFNHVWIEEAFPEDWRMATIVPIAKPGKDPSLPGNYRPIALTSCLCKTMERIINDRLVWYLEKNKALNPYQSGFRRNRSTLDHLVSIETYIRDAMVSKDHVFTVFFDLEKAYDTTWKEGILRDLHHIGLRGRLPVFIRSFLSNRHFKVRVGSSLSDPHEQEMGVPQGSILSPTLFIVKINSINKIVPQNIHRTLFVDDFTISFRGHTTRAVQRQLQLCLGNLQKWCDENGFRFSSTKTIMVHFCSQRNIHEEPVLTLNGQPIPLVEQAKFLGVWFDRKLNFKYHIGYVRNKCQRALNLLRTLAHFNWGADRKTLLKLFRSIIRSTIDYGSVVYGSARPSYLKRLGVVQNGALRTCLGAFRTSPISSLHVEAKEQPIHLRRLQLSLNYIAKLKNDPGNPTFSIVFNYGKRHFYTSKPSFIRPLLYRTEEALESVITAPIAPFKISDVPPWKLRPPEVDTSISKFLKDQHPALFLKQEFYNLIDKYPGINIYTDGSKSNDAVACAFTCSTYQIQFGLPAQMSIYTAELIAIEQALIFIETVKDEDQFNICSDSLSSLTALSNCDITHPYLLSILTKQNNLVRKGKLVVFIWCPSHVGILGNEVADRLAKQALVMPVTKLPLPHTDYKSPIRSYVKSLWQNEWDEETDNKLHTIQPVISEWKQGPQIDRRGEIVLARARIGHSHLTHGYLLRREVAPFCIPCQSLLTVKHILIDPIDFEVSRRKYFNVSSMRQLFEDTHPSKILLYLKEIGLFYRF
jgi:exonuclease III/ribonuclease HI